MRRSDEGFDSKLLEFPTERLVGRFFASATPGPGVVALSGSDGGCPVEVGRRLAAEGLPCLALCYFRAPGLPRSLVEVPVDYVEQALTWLRRQPAVVDGRLGLVGVSKGAELALLCATHFPQMVGAVVAYAPSAVAFAGISFRGDGRRRSSWSYRGEPVPFVPYARGGIRPSIGGRGLVLGPIYRAALRNSAAVEKAAIPVEDTDAPLLLISGGKDKIWPASEMAERIVTRLAGRGRSDQVEHLQFPGAGHSFMPWASQLRSRHLAKAVEALRLAGVGGGLALGGTPAANRLALDEAWSRAVTFLRERLS